jgi:Na+/proline symporter
MAMIDVEHEPRQLLFGAALMLVTAVIQTFGVVILEESVARIRVADAPNMTRTRMLKVLCGVIVYLFALHLLEMAIWAAVYYSVADYRSFSVSLYESALAFTTMDVAQLPPGWKFLSAAEGVTGLLMFAWSTGVMFNQTSWVTEARRTYVRKHHLYGVKDPSAPPPPPSPA